MQYITNSVYPICVEAALRIFKKEQFLFLRFEDLMRMKAPALLTLLSNFTGLHTDSTIIKQLRRKGECEAGRATKAPLSFGKAEAAATARSNLQQHMAEFEAFYLPYDKLLQE